MTTAKKKRPSPTDILDNIRSKAKLDNDFAKSTAIRLKAGKIKIQLLAKDPEHLFRARTQHIIPTIPNDDDKNNKWLVADCIGDDCPVCMAAQSFKNSGISVDDVNEAYNPKYPYKNLRSLFTQNEHYLLCGRVLADEADEGSYLGKDDELGSTHLIQFNKTALNGLMSAYEDFLDDYDYESEDDEAPALFAIFDGEEKANSLVITCRITNQPYSCQFTLSKTVDVNIKDCDEDKLDLLDEANAPVPAEEHMNNCVDRIKDIQNYFIKPVHKQQSNDNNSDLDFDNADVIDDLDFDMDDEL